MRPAAWIPVALFAVLAVALYVGLGLNPRVIPSALIDKPVPTFDLPPLYAGGEGLKTADFAAGEVALLNVFASWCGPCRVEHPFLEELAEGGVTIHGLAYKDDPEDSRRFLAELGNPYERIGVDHDGRAGIDLGVYGVPETYVISPQGRIVYKHVGPILPNNRDGLIAAIEAAR